MTKIRSMKEPEVTVRKVKYWFYTKTMNNEQPKSFEASLEALEQIVRELERGDLPLERSLKLFEQGIGLSRQCQERLNQAERRIEILLKDNQGRPVVSPFEEAAKLSSSSGDEGDETPF